MDHQDWTPVIFNSKEKRAEYLSRIPKKPDVIDGMKPSEYKNIVSDDPEAPKKISLSVAQKIATSRASQGMTQKDLAIKMNVKPEVIRDYENGKAIPNHQVMQKLQRVLNTKF